MSSRLFYRKAWLTIMPIASSASFVQEGISLLRCLIALPRRKGKNVLFFHGQKSKSAKEVCVWLKLEIQHINLNECSQRVRECNENFIVFAIFSILISTTNFNVQSFAKMHYSSYLKIHLVSCLVCVV